VELAHLHRERKMPNGRGEGEEWKLRRLFESIKRRSESDSSARDSCINYYVDDINCGTSIGIGFIADMDCFHRRADVRASVNRFNRIRRFVAVQIFRTFINLPLSERATSDRSAGRFNISSRARARGGEEEGVRFRPRH